MSKAAATATELQQKRSSAVKKSWKDPDVAARRAARHPVKVKGTQYRSVAAAFKELELDPKKIISFRTELQNSANGRAKIDDYTFVLVRPSGEEAAE